LSYTLTYAQKDTINVIKEYTTASIPTGEIIIVDGILEDSAWDNVPWDGNFTVFEPNNGKLPSQTTNFKITYDEKFLYVGIRCLDSVPSKIEKRLSRRDSFSGDWVEVNIDSYNDKRTGFSFNVSAAGVKGDEFISQNGDYRDSSWNPIWYTSTNINEEGWTAEMKIPFSQLKFTYRFML
jgi:hypothetical protein